jgi:hypothetical protein
MPLAIVIIIAALLLAWAGVEVNHVIHAYPGQFWMAMFAFLFVIAGLAARHRAASRPVRIVPEAPPLPKAIQAKPVLTAIASPAADAVLECAGPSCANKLDDDPWMARMPGDAQDSHFCSEACIQDWHRTRQPGVPG